MYVHTIVSRSVVRLLMWLYVDGASHVNTIYRVGPKKLRKIVYTPITLSDINRFLNFYTVGIRRKFVVTLLLKILPHLKCVATLPSEISVFLKQQLKTRRYL